MYLLYFSIFCIKKPWKLCEPVVSLSYYYVLRQCLMLWCKFTVWSLCVLLKVFSSHLLSIAFDINSSPSIAYSSSTDMHFIQMYTNCPCFWVLGGCEIVRFVLKSTLLLAFDMILCQYLQDLKSNVMYLQDLLTKLSELWIHCSLFS